MKSRKAPRTVGETTRRAIQRTTLAALLASSTVITGCGDPDETVAPSQSAGETVPAPTTAGTGAPATTATTTPTAPAATTTEPASQPPASPPQGDGVPLGVRSTDLIGKAYTVDTNSVEPFDAKLIPGMLGVADNIRDNGGPSFTTGGPDKYFGVMNTLTDEGDEPVDVVLVFGLTTPTDTGRTVTVTDVVELSRAKDEKFSWRYPTGCYVDGAYDTTVVAVVGPPADTSDPDAYWPAHRAWRYTPNGLEEIKADQVKCEL